MFIVYLQLCQPWLSPSPHLANLSTPPLSPHPKPPPTLHTLLSSFSPTCWIHLPPWLRLFPSLHPLIPYPLIPPSPLDSSSLTIDSPSRPLSPSCHRSHVFSPGLDLFTFSCLHTQTHTHTISTSSLTLPLTAYHSRCITEGLSAPGGRGALTCHNTAWFVDNILLDFLQLKCPEDAWFNV